MNLYFETYLIITLLIAILIFCIAGSYLKSKKHTIIFSSLFTVIGAALPYFLILFQLAYGSLGEIRWLIDSEGRTPEEMADYLTHVFITYRPNYLVASDYFIHNLGFIILAIAIGVALGILAYLLIEKLIKKRSV